MNPQTEIIDQVKQTLAPYPGLRLIIVYGSVTTGSFTEASDVDIAVLFDVPLTAEVKISLLGALVTALKREIDLVDLYSLSGVLLKQILTKGRIIYRKDHDAVYRLLKRMIYNQSDFMPCYNRAVKRRVEEFIYG